MSNVILICDKSFSKADREIVDAFIEFQQALADKDLEKLDEIVLDGDDFVNLIGSQSKREFISDVGDDILKFNVCEILDPTVIFDDDDSASLMAKVRLTVEVSDRELRVISDSAVSFKRTDGKWRICRWDS